MKSFKRMVIVSSTLLCGLLLAANYTTQSLTYKPADKPAAATVLSDKEIKKDYYETFTLSHLLFFY